MVEMFRCGGECAGTLARARLQFGFEIAEDCYSCNIGGNRPGPAAHQDRVIGMNADPLDRIAPLQHDSAE